MLKYERAKSQVCHKKRSRLVRKKNRRENENLFFSKTNFDKMKCSDKRSPIIRNNNRRNYGIRKLIRQKVTATSVRISAEAEPFTESRGKSRANGQILRSILTRSRDHRGSRCGLSTSAAGFYTLLAPSEDFEFARGIFHAKSRRNRERRPCVLIRFEFIMTSRTRISVRILLRSAPRVIPAEIQFVRRPVILLRPDAKTMPRRANFFLFSGEATEERFQHRVLFPHISPRPTKVPQREH
ncbi:hypothetical protein HN011_009305 [Eciton burchellii]|nr:hypothetical protein HN011_009305 [Eciton burchellii]